MFAWQALSMGFAGEKRKGKASFPKATPPFTSLTITKCPLGAQPHLSNEEKEVSKKDEQQIWTHDFEYKPIIPHKSEDFIYSGVLYLEKLSHPSKLDKKDVNSVLSPDNLKRFNMTVNKPQGTYLHHSGIKREGYQIYN